jgi:hypothetical protein
MRVRAVEVGAGSLPEGLAILAARLDLGDDLNLDAVGVLDRASHAVAAATAANLAVHQYGQNQMIRLAGLAPLFNGIVFGVDGTRVRGHLRIPAEQRERIGDKLLAMLQMVAAARQP